MRQRQPLFQPIPVREALAITVGAGGGIGVISFLTYLFDCPLLIASFGASCVILFALPTSLAARPWNLFGGHTIGSVSGACCYLILGETWYAITIAVVVAILLMATTNTLHPPAGATAIVTVLSHGNFLFVLFPVLTGAAILFVFALLAGRISAKYDYRPFRDLRK